MTKSISDLRQEYPDHELNEDEASVDPFLQFAWWFMEVTESERIHEPNAMTLATVDTNGRPSARIVLLKEFDPRGFVFYTNYQSGKGHQIAHNPYGAIVLYWDKISRQVRVEGRLEQVASEDSDEYFQTRPRESQLSAWASAQSQMLYNRAELEARYAELETQYKDKPIPRPPYWGGYRLLPDEFEFWQGRPSRLHDRLRYRLLPNGQWRMERLSP